MDRRHYLLSLPALLAGCLVQSGDDPSSPSPSPTPPTRMATPTASPEPFGCRPTLKRPDASSLSRGDVESAIENVDSAELVGTSIPESGWTNPDLTHEYVISHPESPDEPIIAAVEPTVTTLPGEVEFRIRNDGEKEFSCSQTGPHLWRADGDTWTRIGPRSESLGLTITRPDETAAWTFTLASDVREYWGGPVREHDLGGLGPGVYAFSIEGYLSDPDDLYGPDMENPVTLVALFGLAGEPLTIKPVPAVVENDGVRIPFEESDDTEELIIEPVEAADGSLTLEQAAQSRHLVRGLPYLFCEEPPDEIVVEVPEETARGVVGDVGTLADLENPREGPARISLLNESFELSAGLRPGAISNIY